MDEQKLLRLAGRGDREAFRLVYQEHVRTLYAVALRVTRNYEDAEEAVQDAFVQLVRQGSKASRIRSGRAWLIQVTTRRSIDLVRRRTARREDPLATSWDDAAAAHIIPLDALTSREPLARDRLHDEELSMRIRELAGQLPERQMLAFTLRHFQGMSLAEVAEAMECSVGAVKSHLHHGLNKMRRWLRQDGFLVEGRTPRREADR